MGGGAVGEGVVSSAVSAGGGGGGGAALGTGEEFIQSPCVQQQFADLLEWKINRILVKIT